MNTAEVVATLYTTSDRLLDTGFALLDMLEEDSKKLAARDLHELLSCWEQYHRLWTVRLHMQHIRFRQESRYPGFYYRADFMGLDDTKWKCFVNSKYDPATGEPRSSRSITTRSSLSSLWAKRLRVHMARSLFSLSGNRMVYA
jgi:succinate dehydrogenase/fumarate reductase flavoprotein subunit